MDYKIGHSSNADAARAVEEACAGLRAPKFIWFTSGVEAFRGLYAGDLCQIPAEYGDGDHDSGSILQGGCFDGYAAGTGALSRDRVCW
ncbi:MAG: hypothetical protein LKE51_11670 [Selenomonas sp.]|jgi:hypothetical protein|nr:hypothetical protein [Selenomonas sp.]